MKRLIRTSLATALLLTIVHVPATPQGPQDMQVRARLRAEQQWREKKQQELKDATEEIVKLTEVLVEEVAKSDGYTTSALLIESSSRIEELAKEIEDLAKTVKRRAQGR